MLVLTREREQVVHIKFGDVVATVKVVKITGNRVQLGIDAPKDVLIVRGEIEGKKDE